MPETTDELVVTNAFGQKMRVGDVVGWGHRDGNESAHQIGIILEFKPLQSRVGTYYKAKCHWVAGGWHQDYASATEAKHLFVLDPSTFNDEDLRRKLAMARRSQLPS